jgi:hypothetical protein
MPLSDWQPIIPRHGRLLAFLRDRAQKRDTEFGIGTGALRDQGDVFTIEQLTEPLYERGMIETLAGYRPAGHLLGIIYLTPVRELCTIEALEVSQ